ncbi:MAG: hypothetical protein P4L22_00840 [Candidatus Babeliales bacterium]|nr:hypothetical protein [Candidatus Babeliales bacterium]
MKMQVLSLLLLVSVVSVNASESALQAAVNSQNAANFSAAASSSAATASQASLALATEKLVLENVKAQVASTEAMANQAEKEAVKDAAKSLVEQLKAFTNFDSKLEKAESAWEFVSVTHKKKSLAFAALVAAGLLYRYNATVNANVKKGFRKTKSALGFKSEDTRSQRRQ